MAQPRSRAAATKKAKKTRMTEQDNVDLKIGAISTPFRERDVYGFRFALTINSAQTSAVGHRFGRGFLFSLLHRKG